MNYFIYTSHHKLYNWQIQISPYPGNDFPLYLLRVHDSPPNKLYFQFAALLLGKLFQIYSDSIHWSQQKRIQTVLWLYNTVN